MLIPRDRHRCLSGLNYADLIKAVNGKLAVGNSKSDGATSMDFLNESVPEDELRAVGRRIMFALGYSDDENALEGTKAEVFPREHKPGKKPRGVNISLLRLGPRANAFRSCSN